MTLPDSIPEHSVPVTVLIAAKNEAVNIDKCLRSLGPAARIVVIDSHSHDGTAELAQAAGAEVVSFVYRGGYPKKRQWALDSLDIRTPWVLLLDADEVVPPPLWDEIRAAILREQGPPAYLITKGFHFLGRRFRFGGFSHAAVLLFRQGCARFEHLLDESAAALDMEVHERLLVTGPVGRLQTPLIHDDYKGLEAYLDRHNRYSTWDATVRLALLQGREAGGATVLPRLFGNVQERRRWLKRLACRVPCEPWLWFVYHYVLRLGFLEGWRGFLASQIRSQYIANVRAKMYEIRKSRHVRPVLSVAPRDEND
jgi:glycosyltransferase involved in cell wall biosynthesis